MLDDPTVPLWITEGVKKADAGAVSGLCIVALSGVNSWRTKSAKGGKVAVADFHDIALNDRRVVFVFDSDVTVKPPVRRALDELAGYLASKGASVEYAHLPHDDDARTGLDDYLVAGHSADDLWRLVRPDPPAVVETAEPVETAAPAAPVVPLKPETSALLTEVHDHLARFICTMHDGDLKLLTLWAAHTHLCVETYTTPRLILDSPVPGAGKTTTLEHLQRLCLNPVQMASLSSPALLTRMLDKGIRTVLIDEADRALNPDNDAVTELLAVLNSGYKRGATRPVLVPDGKGNWDPKEMPTFAPVAMAGNSPNLPDDTMSRSVRVLLLPDITGQAEESDWEYIEGDALALGGRLGVWAEQVRDQVRAERPPLPDGLRGRARERWSPLMRVAVAAGDDWPAIVADLAVKDVLRMEAERDEGLINQRPGVALLTHIHEQWPEGETFVSTERLIDRLVLWHGEMWGDESSYRKRLTAQRMGRMLVKGYDIHSDRPGGVGPRGYRWATLLPAFRRMGLVESPTGSTGSTGLTSSDETGRTPSTYDRTNPRYPLRVYRDDVDADPSDPSEEPVRPVEPVEPAGEPGRCGRCHGTYPLPHTDRHGRPVCVDCRALDTKEAAS
ncbi:MAG: DUF3631 domain-containing protein [Nocardioidaceae bacterium]